MTYSSQVSIMDPLVFFTPAKNPTPSAIMASMAMYLPILPHMVLLMFLAYILPDISHSLYHSISSTGTVVSLSFTDSTVPFFILTTLSAIAVRAELCVIITTVIPPARQAS